MEEKYRVRIKASEDAFYEAEVDEGRSWNAGREWALGRASYEDMKTIACTTCCMEHDWRCALGIVLAGYPDLEAKIPRTKACWQSFVSGVKHVFSAYESGSEVVE